MRDFHSGYSNSLTGRTRLSWIAIVVIMMLTGLLAAQVSAAEAPQVVAPVVASGFAAPPPATITYFTATSPGNEMIFEWRTETEIGNAGFNLYAEMENGLVQLNEALILSLAVDSTSPVDYSYVAAGVNASSFTIEAVSTDGDRHVYGPFALGEVIGARRENDLIDWASIQAERAESAALSESPPSIDRQGALEKGELGGQLGYPEFALGVKEDGIYRIKYEDLKAATGVGLLGVPVRNLALTNKGEAVPVRIVGGRMMGPGVYLEFVGQAEDTLYTEKNVYILSVDRDKYRKMPTFTKSIPSGATVPSYYMETAAFEANNVYSIRSTSDDPWFDRWLHTVEAKTWTFAMDTDNLASSAGSSLSLELWGGSRGEHHVVAVVNGAIAADIAFSGRGTETVSAPLSNLKEGENKLELTLPNDLGGLTDTVALEGYGLRYPRAFVAREGRLIFTAEGEAFTVSGLPAGDVLVYQEKATGPQRILAVRQEPDANGTSVTFAGDGAGTYYVSSTSRLLKPGIELAPAAADILAGQADLLVISHPDFIEGLAPLVAAREAQGFSVKVVDVGVIFRVYSGGVFDAQAIRSYVQAAIAKLGVDYVLLVGADTTAYRKNNGSLSQSFVPTLYAQTDEDTYFSPVDPLFTDVNGDNVPDAALGRFPVRTASELKMMVDKTLMYDKKSYNKTSVFAADDGFGRASAGLVASLAEGWSVTEAYLDDGDPGTTRAILINSLNKGVALSSYLGHSALYNWTNDGIFDVEDAKALSNYGKPSVVTQFGCWNTYYVSPDINTLGHRLLLSGTNGASLVTGATTLTGAYFESELGRLFISNLTEPGETAGTALQEAKISLARRYPHALDVLLGYTMLGDPTAVVEP